MPLDRYDRYLRDPADGVYRHGYNHDSKAASCCKWGRANGWLMMSKLELLLATAAIEAAGANLATGRRVIYTRLTIFRYRFSIQNIIRRV